MSDPQVSVLMPVYNCEPYLDEAIWSIRNQTFTNFEFVIVNDGSTDGSLDIIQRHAVEDERIIILDRPNGGIVDALNAGSEVCRGEYIARMDGDDLSLPSRFERQVAYLDANANVAALGMRCERIDEAGVRLGEINCPMSHEEIDATNLRQGGGGIAHPCAMIRRDEFERVGGYQPEFPVAQDGALWLHLAEVGRLANLPELGLRYRIHAKQTARRRLERFIAVERAVREAALRRGTRYAAQRALHHRNLSWAARDGRRYGLAACHASLFGVYTLYAAFESKQKCDNQLLEGIQPASAKAPGGSSRSV